MEFFYVVYLVDADEDIVIPWTWLRDPQKMLQKFVNYSINNHQTHLCFWSARSEARGQDGRPKYEYEANFNSDLYREFPCTEGTFKCRPIKSTGEFNVCNFKFNSSILIFLNI